MILNQIGLSWLGIFRHLVDQIVDHLVTPCSISQSADDQKRNDAGAQQHHAEHRQNEAVHF